MGFWKRLFSYPFILITLLCVGGIIIADRQAVFSQRSAALRAAWCGRHELAVQGTVTDIPSTKNGKTSFTLKTAFIDGTPADSFLRVVSRAEAEYLRPGDKVYLQGSCSRPPRATNPGCFDYDAYLSRQGIFGLFYPSVIEKEGESGLSPLWRWALGLRQDIIEVINRHIPPAEAEILAPMMIGDTAGLSDETRRAFMQAGVTHVLPT